MYSEVVRMRLAVELDEMRTAGLLKDERILEGPQGPAVSVGGRQVLNFCANNYLGLADDPALVEAAQAGLARWGLGLASVRFICGTQTVHAELEAAIARFLGTDAAILYTSCFDANGGLFETLLGEGDVVISDVLNHASIIDGIRLCRAERHRYAHGDMARPTVPNLDATTASGPHSPETPRGPNSTACRWPRARMRGRARFGRSALRTSSTMPRSRRWSRQWPPRWRPWSPRRPPARGSRSRIG
jgi:hypothetical protein